MTHSALQTIELLVIDGDAEFRGNVARRFSQRGHRVHQAENAATLGSQNFDVVLLTLAPGGSSKFDPLDQVRLRTDGEVVLLSDDRNSEIATEALSRNVHDYVVRPVSLEELELKVARAAEKRQLKRQLAKLQHSDSDPSAKHTNGNVDTEFRLDSIERAHIVAVLQREQGNKARSARRLGVNRRSLYRLIEKHGIGPEVYGTPDQPLAN